MRVPLLMLTWKSSAHRSSVRAAGRPGQLTEECSALPPSLRFPKLHANPTFQGESSPTLASVFCLFAEMQPKLSFLRFHLLNSCLLKINLVQNNECALSPVPPLLVPIKMCSALTESSDRPVHSCDLVVLPPEHLSCRSHPNTDCVTASDAVISRM